MAPAELPIGVLLAFIGVPAFLYLYLLRRAGAMIALRGVALESATERCWKESTRALRPASSPPSSDPTASARRRSANDCRFAPGRPRKRRDRRCRRRSTCERLERALRVAFVTSDEVLPDALRVRDVVAIGRFPHHRWWQWREDVLDGESVEAALEAVGIGRLADRLFSTLSSGERQRVWIALGLAQATPVLLLDEPTSHLDVRVAHEILGLLRKLARSGKTIACVLHDLNDAAAYADRILCSEAAACSAPARRMRCWAAICSSGRTASRSSAFGSATAACASLDAPRRELAGC